MNSITTIDTSSGAGRDDRGFGIRVLVVDDSLIVRSVFSRLVEEEDGLVLAGALSNAEGALQLLASERVDVVLLDLEMPGMGGMAALPQVLAKAPNAKVLVVSSTTADGAEATVQALAQGAADTLQKPTSGGFDRDYREKLVAKIRALGRRSLRREVQAPAAPVLRPASRRRAEIVAIGASTGGIHAIGQLFNPLPRGLGVPILVTQHLLPSFNDAFCRQLGEVSGLPTQAAQDGMLLQPDHVYVAPGKAHLVVVKGSGGHVIRLDKRPAPSGCKPSVDPMFASIAMTHGPAALGVVLTGMGRDGTEGAIELCQAGGTILAQNEASSAVWGMPGSVARAGLASAVLHPFDLATKVARLVAHGGG
ncbi:MAG: chemotaxis-specific protein-glutamate methyltransferase CheB [Erythrobacter sp.]|nr:chemotaxis-specific protein-glutamate methyltransferase CheB [Erythrobacter sp.]